MVLGRLILFLVIGLLVSAFAQKAEAQPRPSCPPYSSPIVLDFKTLAQKPVYKNNLSIQGIRNLFSSHTDPVVGPHTRALGITYAQTSYNAEARSSATTVRGGYCVYLTALDIAFGFRSMEVYVASEFKPGTCEYRSILDHENQHVAVNTGTLRDFSPRFRAEVERLLGKQQPVFTRNAQAGMDIALASFEKGMSAMFDQFQKQMAQRNAPLDSHSNYAATGKLCSNWSGAAPPR